MNLLDVQNLKKGFKRHFWSSFHQVLNGISFSIPSGKITGFLGANGAGKTTTMKCVLGLIRPDSGEIRFFGDQLLSPKVCQKIGFLPERPYFYSYLTGFEFLEFYGQLSGKLKKNILRDRIYELLKRVHLYEHKDQPLRGYSKGMLQKIGFAQAILHEPELIILDEPMSGLDPDGRHYLRELILEASNDGHSIFLSSHLLNDTEQLCENLVILKGGELFYQGATKDLLASMETKYDIQYLKNDHYYDESGLDIDRVQLRITELISSGAQIEKVVQDKITLEEYFVNNVLGKRDESRLDNR